MMWGYHDMYFGPWHLFSSLLWWAFVILLVVWVFRWLGGGRRKHWRDIMMNQNSALNILKERFAKGEINKEEYEEKKKVLES